MRRGRGRSDGVGCDGVTGKMDRPLLRHTVTPHSVTSFNPPLRHRIHVIPQHHLRRQWRVRSAGITALRNAGHQIVWIFSQPDRPAGRGRKLTATPIAEFAIEQNLPLMRTVNINEEILPQADVMIVIAFGQKIAERVVNHPRLGSVNLHASRLPKYRGAAPINAAILGGETIAGNSIIRLAQKMDAGAVLGQSRLDIGELETAGELHDRLALDGGPLMLSVLDQLAAGRTIETPQDERAATVAPKMSRDSSRIDFARPATEIAQKDSRALSLAGMSRAAR